MKWAPAHALKGALLCALETLLKCCNAAGVALPLLQQSMMFWQIGLGYLLLGKRLAPIQVGCSLQLKLLLA